jgi:hypothetical protein
VLQALAPSLLELRLAAFDDAAPAAEHRALLSSLTATLPNMRISSLSAHPALVSSRGEPDIAQHILIKWAPLGSLTLLRSDNPSPQPLSTASLTRLNLVEPLPGLHQQPLLFLAAFTAQLRELHLDFTSSRDAHVVPVAALPPHLTALFCTHARLQLPDAATEGHAATPGPDAAASTSAGAGGLASHGVVWTGMLQLHTLQLLVNAQMSTFVGRGLPDLLRHTPNLKHLVCPGHFRQGCAHDAARLRGCVQSLTHLHLCRDYHAAEDSGAEVEQVCEWVGSLRHLRQLHLERDDIPGPLFAQVSHHWFSSPSNC